MVKNIFPLKNKKVLLVGLGLLGGGLSTCHWLLKQKVKLTITDLKPQKELSSSLYQLKKYKRKIKLVLNQHKKEDFLKNEIIVLNPAVKTFYNPYLYLPKKKNIPIENELTLFIKYLAFKKPGVLKNIVAITGTRGKTTTSYWLSHFLSIKYRPILALNNPRFPLLFQIKNIDKNIEKSNDPLILEIPSYHLELVKNFSPKIAIITNIYPDHLNRYKNIKRYIRVKANIFLYQKKDDYLILNKDNSWTKYFLSLKTKAQIYFISKKPLSLKEKGLFVDKNYLYFQLNNKKERLFSVKNFSKLWGPHSLENLMNSLLASYLLKIDFQKMISKISTLPQIKFRQEEIFSNKYVKIINDSASTIPEATISAIKRFSHRSLLILITGGTDDNLNFKNLAQTIKHTVQVENLILLNDSATKKLINELQIIGFKKFFFFETLKECLIRAKELVRQNQNKKNKKIIVLFSPGAKSFNKFLNEYHRGEIFNKTLKEIFKIKI